MRTFGHRCRTPHGVRELKRNGSIDPVFVPGRTPHEVRELEEESDWQSARIR